MSNTIHTGSHWIIKYYVDEFNEPTKDAYISGRFIGNRRCDRDKDCILSPEIGVLAYIDNNSNREILSFTIYWHGVKEHIISEKYVNLKIKNRNGTKSEYKMYVNEDDSIWIPIDERLKKELLQPNITVLIVDEPEDDYFVTKHYLFEMQADNLSELLTQI